MQKTYKQLASIAVDEYETKGILWVKKSTIHDVFDKETAQSIISELPALESAGQISSGPADIIILLSGVPQKED